MNKTYTAAVFNISEKEVRKIIEKRCRFKVAEETIFCLFVFYLGLKLGKKLYSEKETKKDGQRIIRKGRGQ